MSAIKKQRFIKGFIIVTLAFLTLPFLAAAQPPTGMTRRDSVKMDSIRTAFLHIQSMRMDSIAHDTTANALIQSPFQSVYLPSKNAALNGHKLLVQAVRFRHTYYLNILVKVSTSRQFVVATTDQLRVTFADNSTATLANIGGSVTRANGMKNGSDLAVEFALQQADFANLINKKIISVSMDYQGGIFSFNLDAAGATNIQTACLAVR